MQWLIYWVFGALLVATIVLAIVVGGWVWITPVLALVLVAAYAVFDARTKRNEGRGERAASTLHPDRS
jgi:4-hydroxybenzoate polyprenyltransferase